MGDIRFGVAGWSYPDWEGIVYAGKVRDPLEFLAGYVDLIEINSSFYRPPTPANAESWLRRTERFPDFRFSAKLHQDFTHGLRLDSAPAFREGVRPLAESGRLSHLLAQFRYDVSDSPSVREHLRALAGEFGGTSASLVLELRHASWQAPEALSFLESLGVTVANLDYPLGRDSFSLAECRVGRHGYLRLHGRNRAAWFDKATGRDATYDYLYAPAELRTIRDRALSLASTYETLTIVANNHFRGKEVANILELEHLVTGTKVAVPPGLLAEYPRLLAIAREIRE